MSVFRIIAAAIAGFGAVACASAPEQRSFLELSPLELDRSEVAALLGPISCTAPQAVSAESLRGELSTDAASHRCEAGALPAVASPAVAFAYASRLHDAGDELEAQRNLAYAFLNQSDWLCDQYMTDVAISRNTASAALETGALASSALGSVAGVTGTANVFSAFSSFATGTRSVLEDEVFRQEQFDALLDALEAHRATRRNGLMAVLRDAETPQDLAPVRIGIASYHASCGVNRALASLSSTASNARQDAEDALVDPSGGPG